MDLAQRLTLIQQRIAAACARVGRNPAEVTLVAVSKGHGPDAIKALHQLGCSLFGENKIQEAKAKMPLCPGQIRWHMIGHLQSNKARDAVIGFEMIESVDRLSLAVELNKWAEKSAKTIPILLEVNIAGESTKFGFSPDQLLAELASVNALPRLEIHGLMAMAPWSPDPEKARPIFRRLRELRSLCADQLGAPLPHLSMGMSGDFEVAIEEGATMVRIGTALFGERPKRSE